MVKRSFMVSLLLFASSSAFSCYDPAGSGRCGPSGIGPRNPSGYNNSAGIDSTYTPSYYSPRVMPKSDSFAAMASSTKSGKVATVTHKHSIAEANKEAIRKCERATGEKCILMHSFQNGCMTAASGMVKKPNGYHLFPASASTGYEAETKAMAACNAAAVDCLPVFEEPICSFF